MPNPTQEIIVKRSVIGKVVGYVFIFFTIALGILLFFAGEIMGTFVFLVGPIILFVFHDEESKIRPILLKISPDGLWTPKHGYKPWSNIKSMRFKYAGNRRPQRYIEIYRGNPFYPDEVIDLGGMNMLKFRLKRELRKYTQVN